MTHFDHMRLLVMPTTHREAYEMLGRVSFYLAAAYPFIKKDVHRITPERKACEIILACKDLIELVHF